MKGRFRSHRALCLASSFAALVGCYAGLPEDERQPADPNDFDRPVKLYTCASESTCTLTPNGGFWSIESQRNLRLEYMERGDIVRGFPDIHDDVCPYWCVRAEQTLYRCCVCNDDESFCEFCQPVQPCGQAM